MSGTAFLDFYKSDLQSVYALCVVPLLFLAYLLWSPEARSRATGQRFLYVYCVVFALETIVDPIATGPFLRWLGAGEGALGTAIPLTFVLLGDFRVYLLIFAMARLARPEPNGGSLAPAFLQAAAWTLVVPIVAYTVDSALHRANPGLPEQTIWLAHELAFLSIALWLRVRGIARRMPAAEHATRRGLEAVAGYAAVYYALWATADVLILVFGLDVGWALRVIPNQLYYAFFLPFAYFQLSSRR
ncbi:MAG: hypothetical protein ABR538_11380 [Candidatus Binatia bacterium]